ncbi:epiplakin [Falco peregrinus]|uniref:epiplakin n=1 Tax=Falco peregrinus TaxID=8954 RepID=UPI002478FF5A|nr:epiplakin [Falco peregrinus]
MESKPAVNGHAALISHQENMPGANHLCQDIMPCKQKKAADRDVTVMDASSEPSKAAGSVAGVYVEVSKKIMSFYDATREHLLSLDSALCLLEAQAAMGFIIDPVKNRHVSVAEAVHLGLVGLELKERLLAAEKAATGFVDPYTEEKISLYQAIQKDLIGREQGTRLLEAQIATGGIIEPATGCRLPADVACERGYLDEEMSQLISDPSNEASKGFLNPSTMERVTYTELIKRCIVDPASGFLLLPLQITFPGLGGRVSSRDLFDSGIISSDMFRGLEEGRVSAQEVAENDSVQQFLHGTRSVAGVVLPSGERKSLYQALREHLLVPGTALMLLQVQASTGSLTDPIKNKSYSVDEAVRVGLIGPELHEKLSSAERTITGYRDPYTGEMLSLFQAIRKGFIPKDHGICLLEAQMATGGIIAPGRHLRVPTETACKWGYLDEATRQLLSSPTDDMKGFFDPSSKEKLTYADLLKRCVTDPNTGLLLLPIGGDSREESKGTHLFFDHRTQTTLENTQVSVALGKFKGKSVSLWKLLFSDYIQSEQRAALTQQYLAGMLSTQELGKVVSATIEEMASTANVTFEGLRDRVTADQLLSSEIINKDLFKKLKEGETSAKEVVGMDTVKKYLQGTGSIGGLLLPDSQEKISIYQAKRKGLLRPGTSLILLEAQAATGFIIDPAANKRYSVDEALRANIIGPDVYNKLLTAEKSVTGYRDPYSGNKISLFQAMKKEFIVKEHAIRLLEAQIATGGIIDPVNSHRIPVEVAYKRGYFDKKMNVILSDPSDDTKGFFDPNTHENLTYLQLKEKCITEPSTGLCLLPLNSRKRQFIDDDTRRVFRSSWLPVRFGRLRGEKVSVWDLLNSEYFSEGRRREIFNHYQLKKLTLEQIRIMLEEEMKKWAPIKFPAMRGSVSAYHLMETGVIDKALFEKVLEGSITPKEVLHMDSVRKYLYGSGSIGGVVLQPSNQRLSIYEAMKQNIVVPGVALPLLEAQAATGFIIDPVNNQKLCVDDAVKEGVIGPEVHEKLQHAEGAVTGYKDPFTGKKIPLFQAMKKGLIADSQAMQLMEVQMATGGIIDPACGHYIPIESAQKRGCLDEDTSKALSKPSDNNRTFCVPDSKETVTYAELIKRCQKDEISGFHLLPLPQTAAPAYTDEQIQQIFKETVVKEKGVSLWELIHSGYFTEEQGRHFVERFRSEEMSLEQLVALVLRLVEEMEMKARTQITFEGLRGSVPAVWLLDAGIITEKMFEELAQGRRAPEEVAAMESVKRYLQGTGSIAGVFIEASKKKMSFYDAMKNNLLLPGAALRLLEAQAATGYLTDPATNQRLSVRDAVKAAVVGEELTEKLLLAERAVTGYTDPYTGNSISLCQALRKELIPLEDAIPFLEAQLATGGVIDPIHHHHLPLQAACRYGFYDENLNQTLSRMNDSTKVFFDPNTKENVTYQQLKDRCIHEAESGLWLLPLSENVMFCVDEQTMEVMKSVTVCVNVGRFKGQTVSVWDLLNSEYLSDGKRRELVQKYKDENTEVLQEIVTSVTTIIKETETQGKKFAFRGLRKRVSASDLFQSQLIDKKTLDELNQGKKTVKEVTEMDSVRRYLEGSNFIAGVLIQPSNEKMSIYQAMRKGILRPGTALVLLEAQAATGYIIDPEKNKKFSVEEALTAGLIGGEIFEKLLCAERAVTGYTDPYTKAPMSLFEAMNQGLIVKSHGIRLLEAQIATGGIIDPVHSHRLPVEVAYRRGYFDQEMNQILSDPSDDTKGFFDPNTHENLTYMQLLERCVQDSETGLYMLQVVQEGGKYFYIDELTKQVLRLKPLKVKVGKFKDQTVSIWEILCSHYISEQKRKELVMQYKSKTLTLEDLTALIMKIIEDTEQRAEGLKVKGLRGYVSISELFNSEIIDKKTLDQLQDESLTLVSLTERDTIKRYLDGTGCIAGVLLPSRKEKMSIYQALNKGLLTEQCALGLLEAQAATGFLIDPLKNKKLSVDEAVSSGLVGRNLHKKLLSAEKAVTGYEDPHTGNKISLFQAIRQKIIVKEHGIRLLEAQIATGGIIDPVNSHRLPVEVAYRRGYLDDDMFILLSDPDHGTKGFIDPNTHEKISYSQLLQRCSKDRNTGLYLLQVMEKDDDYFYIDEHTKTALLCTKVEVPFGKYKGQVLSLWELLCSEYITEEKRKELIKKYKDESHNILQGIIDIILNIMKEKEEDRNDVWFQGIRQQITASELLSAGIITEETMENLHEGKERAQDIAKMDTVRKYLEGTGSIAGVLVPSKADPTKMEKMSIYQAMWKGILRQGTALVLLEAQAATGFLIDPCKNKKFSVDEAVSSGLVGSELQKKLLTAERAVTGYTDPCTGKKMSLFQAMKKELIVKEHGIRLLEAQIATGGIIDPVHSHRLPVEVAYRRGYFDQEMNQILSDPSDDTKGFFDPNTHENLTYMQLLHRCVPDPDTGLLMLQLMDKGSVLYQLTEDARKALQDARTTLSVGLFQGQSVTVWELLFSCYVPDHRRQDLLRKYKAGTVTISEMITLLTAIISTAEGQGHGTLQRSLKSHTVEVSAGGFQGRKVSLWELLFSKYVSEAKRQELLGQARARSLALDELARLLTVLVEEAAEQSSKMKFPGLRRQVTASDLNGEATGPWQEQEQEQEQEQQLQRSLKSHTVEVSAGGFQGRKVSLWELLFSKYVSEAKRQELLGQARARSLALDELARLLTVLVEEAAEQSSKMKFPGLRRQVTASDLVDSGIIDKDTLADLVQGSKTVEEVTEMASVKRYLDGTGCIAGVLVPSKADPTKMEKMSIYQAMWKGILRQGTALVLLEAQAATGFLIDPLTNEKLSVDEAISSGLVGSELHEKLLSAERAVTGYTDPYTGDQISLFQAMKKELIVKEHGIRLLEAQIATGGIIDPVHSHRLPVEVAYRRGYFDQEMNQILSDPSDDTKGFFDPNTHENLTYMQLLHRCVPDPDTGLLMLQLMDKGSVLYQLTEDARKALQDARTTLSVGLFQGQSVTVWELLFSRYVPDHRRQDLLRKYKAGTVTISEMITLLTAIISTAEGQGHGTALARKPVQRETAPLAENGEATGPWQEQEQEQEQEQQLQRSLKSHTVEVSAGGFQGRKVSLWELLFSKYVSEAKRQELLGQARARSLALDELARLLTVLVEEAAEQSSKMKFPGLRRQVTASDLVDSGIIDKDTLADLVQGSKTVEEVTEMASVKRYLDGTGCIAGVLVPSKADPTKMEKMSIYQAMWKGILRQGTALVLLEAQAATGFLIDPLTNEKLSVDEAISSGLVGSELHEKLLSAERAVTGYTDPYTGDQMSLFQAMKKELIVKEHGIRLLEAQIATGGIIDPVHSHRLPVEVAYRRGYFDQEMNQILSDPSDDTKGFFDPNTHENLTYMQLLHRCVPDPDTGLLMLQLMDKGSVLYQLTEDARKALQDARTTLSVGLFQGQSVTVWELLFSRYVPDHRRQDLLRKYKAGTVTISEMITLLTAIISTAEGQGHGTALARKPVQRETAPLAENGEATGPWQEQEQEQEQEQQLQRSLKSHTVEVSAGGFQGRKVSLWELLFSKYVSEAKRQELLGQARARSLALDELARLLTVLVEEAAEQSSKMKFPGLRRQVTASDLVDSGIIDKDTLADLVQGSKTVEEVTEMASVKRYLDGTGCIAGVLVPSKADPTKMEKMSIYQAMWKGILRQGTALVLLEAQAATGFLIDPLTNEKLSVDEAISSGLVGSELHEKLLSAERAVTGYTDPYTGDQMSLFQAMKKELIVKEHGIRLLEAQIATGGIIDPVHSHRLPVEVAYRRGYFDQEMNQILSDPSDDTKGFFDPNTHENLTYMQLLHRCVPDPDTGLLMLQLMDKGSVLYQLTEDARKALQDARTTLSVGLFQGQSVTVWELLFSRYVPDHRRQDLLRKYKAGTVTISEMITLLTAIISTAEGQGHGTALARKPVQRETAPLAENGEATGPWQEQEQEQEQEQQLQRSLKSHTVEVSAGGFQGRKVSLWELLFSKYVSEAKRQELLGQARARSLALDELARLLTVLVEEAAEQSSKMKFPGLRRQVTASDLVDSGIIDKDTLADLVQGSKTVEEVTEMASVKRYLDGTGCIAGVLVPSKADPTKMEKMSIYQAMWKGILRQGTALVLLEAQAATGFLIDPLTNEKLSVDEAISSGLVGSELHEKLLSAERAVTGYTDPYTGDQISLFQAMKKELIVKEHGIRLLEAQIATGGIIDPVHSHRLPVEVAYRRGYFDQEMNQILSDPSDDTKGFFDPNTHENLTYMQLLHRCVPDPDTGLLMLQLMDKGSVLYQLTEDARKALQDARTTLSVGLFQGQSVTVWELLFSRYVPDHRRQDLLRKYKAGTVTISEMITLLTAIISTAEGQGHGTALARKPVQRETAPLAENGEATGPWQEQEQEQEQEQQLQRSLKSHTVEVSAGGFQGRKVSLWELLFSKYVSEAKRQGLLGQARARSLALDELARLLTVLVEEAAEQSSKMKFPGLRRQVTASDLVDSGIIDKDTLADLVQGSKTVEEVTEMASVKRYLDGTGCIAGVLVPSKADPTKMEKMSIYQAMWKGILRQGTALVLLEAQAATGFLIDPLTNEKLSVDEAISSGLVGSELHEKLLSAERAVTGYTDPYTGDQMSLFQAMKKELIVKEHGIRLLEAQIATGGIIDPVHSHRLPVEVAYRRGYFDQEMNQILSDPSDDTKGFFDPNTHENLTYMQLLHRCVPDPDTGLLMLQLMDKGSVLYQLTEDARKALQDARTTLSVGLFQGQSVTVWELLFSRYVPDHRRQDLLRKYKAGTVTISEMITLLTAIISTAEGQGHGTALARKPVQRETAPLAENGEATGPWQEQEQEQEQEQQLQRSLKSHTVEVSAGGFQGRKVSLWELLFSKYVSEAKRQELLGQARARSLALDELARLLTVLVEEAAEQSSKMKFPGLRRQVTASDLVDSGIIDKDTLADLVQGSKTVEEVTEMASVKCYLDGTGCIAGVLVPSKADPTKMEKMSIYQAMWKGILRQGTALVLLEAQAATGFLIDPLTNEKLSVDEAISSGLVGSELHEKLLSAERAVTGYTDPYTGDQISLFQAMKKELIVKEHGIRLLEAQIATGGIIDPVHSHRLPVEVAYRRGYFDQEMNQILSDPSDDTKGFFDPNTHENLTYMQLLHRCVPDPDTGLLMLQLMDKGSVLYQLTEDARKALQDARTTLSVGLFQGQSVTVWELLFSRYVPDHRRQDLLRKYKAGTVTISEMITLLTAIISTAEGQGHGTALARKPVQRETAPLAENGEATGPWQEQEQEQEQEQQLQRSLKSHTVEVSAGGFQGRKVSLWELLFSKYVSEAKRQELLGQARARSLALDELARLLTVLVEEAAEQSSKMKFPGLRRQVTASDLVDSGIIDKDTLADLVQGSKTVEEVTEMASVKRYLDGTGCIAGVLVPSKADPTKMEKMSIYQAMWKGILRQGTALVLLEAQAATGFLIDPLTNEKLSVDEAISSGLVGSELHEKLLSAERAVTGYTDPYTGDQISLFQAMKKELIVKEHGIRLLEAQIATGGIIDPVHSHRLPVEVAYRRGYFDQEMNQILSDPSDDTKGFFDPNTHENLTYMQLLHRCVPDPDTGLLMLQLMDKGSVLYQLTEDARKALQDARTTLSVGLFQGQSVTVWELLFSRYVPDHRRQDLLRKYKAGTVTISEMITLLTAIISTAEGQGHGTALARKPVQRETAPLAENGEATGPWQEQEQEQEQEQQLQRSLKSHTVEVSAGGFQGRKVSLWELLFSKYVSEAKRQELLGQARARSLALDELARLLTVLVEEAAEQSSKMKFPGLRRQVTASDLVDSGIIDKDTLADLVQGSKTVEEVTEMASVKCYLDGTGCIAGVLVPSKADPTKMEKMSIYQAMWKGILRQGTALVLLEAQAATGFLIDPLTNEKLSVDEAISSGLVGSELHEKLLSAERAVTGYTDPYTGDQISLFQAMKKELIVKEHGIRLLEAQIATGGIIDPVHSHRLPVEVAYRRGYFDQEMNQILSDPSNDTKGFFDPNTHENLTYMQLLHRCVPDPMTGLYFLQGYSPKTMQKMSGSPQNNKSSNMGSNLLDMGEGGSSFIAGVFIQTMNKKMSIYDAMMRGLLTPGTALVLLEAQAASGFLTDPVKNEKLSVKEALTAGLIGRDFYEKLLSAEGAVTGYTEPYTGHKISLFQAMKKEFIVKEHAIRLLEAQIATGGIIDPVHSHRLPVEVAYKRGYFDQEMCQFLSNPKNQTRSCFDPNTHENLTYTQLLRRCVPDPDTGLLMLHVMDKGSVLYQLNKDARKALQDARTTLSVGLFQGQSVTVWELLFSRYIPDHQREELLRKYKAGTVTIPEMITILTTIITRAETEKRDLSSSTVIPNNEVRTSQPVQDTQSQEQQLRKSLKSATIYVTAGEFQGQNISLLDLLFSKYIPQGKRQELLELYRAGILTTEQVATVVTTIINRTESANAMLMASARSPHKAVTRAEENGDDFSTQDEQLDNILKSTTVDVPAGEFQGKEVSVWDLLFSDYIPEEKRQELLELYRERVLTVEQMITVVTTVIKKKETTSRKFLIADKTSGKDTVSAAEEKEDDSTKEEPWETALKTTVVDVEVGEFQGHKVSVWDLLHSKYIPEENRKELLELYQAGELTLDQVKTIVSTIVTKAEAARAEQLANASGPRAESTVAEAEHTCRQDRTWEETLKSTTVEMSMDEFQGKEVSVWDLLFSDYIPEEKRQELLELYCAGTLALERLIIVITALIKKKASTGRKFLIAVKTSDKDTVSAEEKEDDSTKEEPWETALKTTVVDVEVGEFQGHKVSVWDLLHSKYIPEENRKELLELYQAGELTLDQVKTVVSTIVTKAEAARAEQLANASGPRAESTVAEAEHTCRQDRTWEETLKSTTVEMSMDEFQGKEVSVWDLLFSDYIPEEKRQELLELYRAGTLTIQELVSTTSSIVTDSKERHLATLPQQTVDLLQSEGSYITFGPFQEQRVSVWELLSSKQVSEYKREAHLDTYGTGGLTVNKITITTTVIIGPQHKKRHH